MHSILRTWSEPIALILLGFWGLVSAFQGAGLSMFVSGSQAYAATSFIELVYFGVIASVFVSLLSARLAAIFAFIDSIIAAGIIVYSGVFYSIGGDWKTFASAIALRPLLASIILAMLPVRGPMLRAMDAKRKHHKGEG